MKQEKETIVLIHGLWMTSRSWEHWVARYTAQGYNVIAKSWPGMDVDIDELRNNPAPIERLGIHEIVEHYEDIIRGLDSPPIVIGHSFGGLIAQILLDRGYGSAGVAIASAPVKGIFLLPFSTLKSSFPGLRNPANDHRALPLTPEEFHYAFTNTLTEEESLKVYQRYAVPGPDHVLFQAAFANFNPHAATTVNFHNDSRAPLLLISGGKDHVSPASVVEANYRLYAKSKAVTDYKEYPERSHYTLGQTGWEDVADYALSWATSH
jgi:pimeloyl-ACP methyl ester carboxylesterase